MVKKNSFDDKYISDYAKTHNKAETKAVAYDLNHYSKRQDGKVYEVEKLNKYKKGWVKVNHQFQTKESAVIYAKEDNKTQKNKTTYLVNQTKIGVVIVEDGKVRK